MPPPPCLCPHPSILYTVKILYTYTYTPPTYTNSYRTANTNGTLALLVPTYFWSNNTRIQIHTYKYKNTKTNINQTRHVQK